MPITLLIIGDVSGRIGRRTLAAVIPKLRNQYGLDVVIANVENIAHGVGMTAKTLTEVKAAGVDIGTTGNHTWDKEDPTSDALTSVLPYAMPANDPRTPEPFKVKSLAIGSEKVSVINLLGQFEMGIPDLENPFKTFDTMYEKLGQPKNLMVDFHAEATSEKVAFGLYVDGRASVVFGTHTHIPTADHRILPHGTGYITDLGMTGSNDSVLGVKKETVIARFLGERKGTFECPETGPAWLCGIVVTLDDTGRCSNIIPIQEHITI